MLVLVLVENSKEEQEGEGRGKEAVAAAEVDKAEVFDDAALLLLQLFRIDCRLKADSEEVEGDEAAQPTARAAPAPPPAPPPPPAPAPAQIPSLLKKAAGRLPLLWQPCCSRMSKLRLLTKWWAVCGAGESGLVLHGLVVLLLLLLRCCCCCC